MTQGLPSDRPARLKGELMNRHAFAWILRALSKRVGIFRIEQRDVSAITLKYPPDAGQKLMQEISELQIQYRTTREIQ